MFKTVKIKANIIYDEYADLVSEILSDTFLKGMCLLKKQSTNFTYEYLFAMKTILSYITSTVALKEAF